MTLRINARHSNSRRGLDAYWTPPEATRALMAAESAYLNPSRTLVAAPARSWTCSRPQGILCTARTSSNTAGGLP
jgi:hypothetical protein